MLNTNVNNNLSKKMNYSDGKKSINLTFDMREYHYADNNLSSLHTHINVITCTLNDIYNKITF